MRNSQLKELVTELWRLSERSVYVPLCVWGEAGIGKSEAMKQAASELQIDLVDLRLGNLEAPDLMGLQREELVYPCLFHLEEGTVDPARSVERFTASGLWHHTRIHHPERIPDRFRADPQAFVAWTKEKLEKTGYGSLVETRTVYSAPLWFPAPETAGILFLDEMNRAQRETKQGVFQLVLDRRIHELELPPRWIVVSANNPPSVTTAEGNSKYDVDEDDDKAFVARFCHVALDPSSVEWAEYAQGAGVEATIRSLLQPSFAAGKAVESSKARKLLGLRSAPIPSIEPTPRSWAMLGRLLSQTNPPPEVLREICEGLVGKAWVPDPDKSNTEKQVDVAKVFLDFLGEEEGVDQVCSLAEREQIETGGSVERLEKTPYLAIEEVVDLVRKADPKAPARLELLREILPAGDEVLLDTALQDVGATR